jgi:hypothetical protein
VPLAVQRFCEIIYYVFMRRKAIYFDRGALTHEINVYHAEKVAELGEKQLLMGTEQVSKSRP